MTVDDEFSGIGLRLNFSKKVFFFFTKNTQKSNVHESNGFRIPTFGILLPYIYGWIKLYMCFLCRFFLLSVSSRLYYIQKIEKELFSSIEFTVLRRFTLCVSVCIRPMSSLL